MEVQKRYPERDYSSLSVRDLIDARDHYHVHLAHKPNVVSTAIGRYRIHKDDWFAKNPPSKPRPVGYPIPKEPKTLFNTVVRDWSWPCVMVFVDQWVAKDKFAHPDQAVPRALYLPDGRVVPTCTIEMTRSETPLVSSRPLKFPKTFIGGGYPVLSDVQGREHIGSVGCLVTDGNVTYALTNRHVTGEEKRDIFTLFGGERTHVGVSDSRQIGKKAFEDVYDGWPGKNVYCNIDAGLIRVDDLSRWTTQILGVGEIGRLLDLDTDTLTLDLIDCPVRGFGAVSGELYGRIIAFFYRYKSVGGFEYITDLVIAPRPDPNDRNSVVNTHPGDSGTLWCFEEPVQTNGQTEIQLRPMALQWGGQVMMADGTATSTAESYTLATALSTICRELDVDLLRDWNTGLPEYWGAVGHYTIAAIAPSQVTDKKLKKLLTANALRISYDKATILKGAKSFNNLSTKPFIPLADVPDYAWKGGARGGEQPNHFADMDKVIESDGAWTGKTLLELCVKDDANVDVDVWMKYYTLVKDGSRGTLPFRIWQIFSAMKKFAGKQDVTSYVAAAGVLAHYVGDACQPLHISYMYNGEPMPDKTKRGDGVHHAYEALMFNSAVEELWTGVEKNLKPIPSASIKTGRDAAIATVALMKQTFDLMKPKDIVDAFVAKKDLWQEFGAQTKVTMANGVRLLAHLWNSAWKEGGGSSIADSKLKEISEAQLAKKYQNDKFLPSVRLKDMAGVLD